MLVTIRNLPANTRYADLKSLIVSKCGLTEMILDNMTPDGYNTKKVTVGLAEEEDAAILMRKINGLLIEGHQVFVEALKKKQNQGPGSFMGETAVSHQPSLQQPYYQQSSQPSNYQVGYNDLQQNGVPTDSYAAMFRVPTAQNAFANYGYPQQMQYMSNQMMAPPVANFDQDAPLGFSNQGNSPSVWANQNDWNSAGSASGVNRTSQQNRNSSRWDNSDDNVGRPHRNAPTRDRGRDGSSRNFGRDAASRNVGRSETLRGSGRDAPSRARGRDEPRDQRRDAPNRERGGDRGRDAPARNPSGRDYSRNDLERAPLKRQFPAINAPGKSSGSPMNKFPHQQRFKPGQNQNTPTRKAQGDNIPPVKRPRTNDDSINRYDKQGSAYNVQFQTPNKKKPKKNDPETLINRASTWRGQIASAVAKGIMKNPKFINDVEPQIMQELKRSIRHRLDLLLGEDIKVSQKDMLMMYRTKYSVASDAELLKKVTEDYKNQEDYIANEAVTDAVKPAVGAVKKPKPTRPGAVVKEDHAETVKKIPMYPQGDKQLNKELKKANKQMFNDAESVISQLNPNMQTALIEEIEEMSALITEEFQDEPEPGYEGLHRRVKTSVIDEYKQMLKVNFTKRVLNIQPIMLRIFNIPKVINRSKLAPILAEYGIDSLRKSDKKPPMYFGTCKNYEYHDKLCAMEPLVVDGSRIVIKPFHLTGFNDKLTKEQIKLHRQKRSQMFSNGDSKKELEESNAEDKLNLNVEDDQDQGQSDNNQPDNENPEPKQDNKENEAGEAIEIVGNGNTQDNENELEGNVTQETCQNETAKNSDSIDTEAEAYNEDENTELDKQDSTEHENLETAEIKSKENDQLEAPTNIDVDFTGESAVNDESHIEDNSLIDRKPSESDNDDEDKDVEPKNYEDIDMDDLDDDDLEDW